jgi:hypothetical protein
MTMPDGTCECCGEFACDCGRCAECDFVFLAAALDDDNMCRACRPLVRPVTDPDVDAPDGAEVDGYVRHGDQWWRQSGR